MFNSDIFKFGFGDLVTRNSIELSLCMTSNIDSLPHENIKDPSNYNSRVLSEYLFFFKREFHSADLYTEQTEIMHDIISPKINSINLETTITERIEKFFLKNYNFWFGWFLSHHSDNVDFINFVKSNRSIATIENPKLTSKEMVNRFFCSFQVDDWDDCEVVYLMKLVVDERIFLYEGLKILDDFKNIENEADDF